MEQAWNFEQNKIVNTVELLAPAGTYESFLGAIHAGADAVYLAGQKFGARAYAGNFSTEELCRAIHYAHLSDRKVYLTLNTLVKESEFSEIYDYLKPFYEEGLDGIIIQDLGVLRYVKEEFPKLPLHISTQAAVTGLEGARFLKEQGAVRVVPARELSLKEICRIKEETGLELETFIHGAMCYCYSGQCLFSSIAGGRSGNRGRCAQPCRLPYQLKMDGKNCFPKESYPLSLKDMCTLQDIPKLLEAGIDSFKIEGRMKKPEYAAGVTAIYRKYIDRWYKHPEKSGTVDTTDMQKLSSLYIRSEVQNGYYFRHNGEEMITLKSPAYSGSDDKLLEEIRKEYLTPEKKQDISAFLYCNVGEPLMLTLYSLEESECCVSMEGPVVEKASKQPVNATTLQEKISKLGNTFFEVKECQIEVGEDCFIPMKVLNDLRREAVTALEDAILKQKSDNISFNMGEQEAKQPTVCENADIKSSFTKREQKQRCAGFSVLVSTPEQFEACLTKLDRIQRLYIESDLVLFANSKQIREQIKALKASEQDLEIYLALPFIIRLRDQAYLEQLKKYLREVPTDGCLIRNVEELGLFTTGSFSDVPVGLALDAGMYSFQTKTIEFYNGYADTISLPYELNGTEKRHLKRDFKDTNFEQVVFGRVPMMVTANCLAKTAGACNQQQKNLILVDRYNHEFPVQNVCNHCYNIIWNCLPMSLHTKISDYDKCIKRIQFTTESGQEAEMILNYFLEDRGAFPVKDYTTGHEKRGVE